MQGRTTGDLCSSDHKRVSSRDARSGSPWRQRPSDVIIAADQHVSKDSDRSGTRTVEAIGLPTPDRSFGSVRSRRKLRA